MTGRKIALADMVQKDGERINMNSKDKPLVTVITLSYKKYKYIYDAIRSVLNQDYEKIQYIIADDGAINCPKSNINDYVEKYSRENIKEFKLVTRKKNVGTVKNLNDAVRMANGKYIVHLSADDVFYSSDVVSRIVKVFEERQCDVLGMLRLGCDENLKPIRYMPTKYYQCKIEKWKTSHEQYIAFVTGNHFEMASGSVLTYKKKYWEKHPFDESYVLWEDGPFIEEYLRNGNFLELDYSFTAIYYRAGGISTSGVINPLMDKDVRLFNSRNYKNVQKDNMGFWVRKKIEYELKASIEKKENISRIKRNIKYFYLLPMKMYFMLERWLIYRIEMLLIRANIMK